MSHTNKLLEEIANKRGITAIELASKLYPDSVAWGKTYDGGNDRGSGSLGQQGKGIWLAVGSQVGKLRKKGFVRHYLDGNKFRGYEITAHGLKEIEKEKKSEIVVTCPECGSSNKFDLGSKYECDDCGEEWIK